MTPADLGALTITALVIGGVALARVLGRLLWRDRIYDSLTPGTVPRSGEQTPTSRVRGGQEYSGEIPVAFAPPRHVTPGLVGTLIDGSADPRDLTATIVHLASRGWLTIAALGADQQPLGEDQQAADWLLTQAAEPPPNDHLDDFEADLYQAIFRSGERPQVAMSTLTRSRETGLARARASLYQQVVQHGWYDRPPNLPGGRLVRVGAIAAAVLVFFALAAIQTPIGVFSGAIAAGALLLLPRWLSTRVPRTADGTAVRIQALGFKKYLATAEADQFSFEEAAGIFSRYLPYAIVFGVADHWAKVFADLATKARLEGYGDLGFTFDWFDAWMISYAISDLASLGELGALADFADIGSMVDAADVTMSGALGSVGDVVSGVGDFISSIDFGDFNPFD